MNLKILSAIFPILMLFHGCSRVEEESGFTPVVFNENDFTWDKNTAPYKEILINQVNMLQYNNKLCRDMEPGTLSMSNTKGTKDDPVFFITCGKGAEIQNVFFSKSTVEENFRIHQSFKKDKQ